MPVQMPDSLSLFSGITRLRSSHLDRLSYESSVLPRRDSSNALNISFFYRTHMYWNSLTLKIKEIRSHEVFKREVKDYLWKMVHDELIDNDIDISLTTVSWKLISVTVKVLGWLGVVKLWYFI